MDIITPSLVLTSLDAKDKKEVIYSLSSLLLREHRISDLDSFAQNVLEREKEFSTGFGQGIAIPHGKTTSVLKASVVVAKLAQEIEWDSMDDKPVHLIFLLAVPQTEAGTTHLKILARLAESLMDDEVLDKLAKIENKQELYQYLITLLGGKIS